MPTILHLVPEASCATPDCTAAHTPLPPPAPHTTTTWRTHDGRVLDVTDMTPAHALNAYLMLHRNAWTHAFHDVMYQTTHPLAPCGEMANDAFDRHHEHMLSFPHAWLDSTPLVTALWDRASAGFLGGVA